MVRRASSLSALFSVKWIQSGRATEWTLEPGRDIERRYTLGLPHLAALLTIGLATCRAAGLAKEEARQRSMELRASSRLQAPLLPFLTSVKQGRLCELPILLNARHKVCAPPVMPPMPCS